jgi:hypothetical protein
MCRECWNNYEDGGGAELWKTLEATETTKMLLSIIFPVGGFKVVRPGGRVMKRGVVRCSRAAAASAAVMTTTTRGG